MSFQDVLTFRKGDVLFPENQIRKRSVASDQTCGGSCEVTVSSRG